MTFIIRRATPADTRGVAALFNQYRMFYQQADDLAKATKFIDERLSKEESVIFIAEQESDKQGMGELIGFTQLYPTFSSVSAQRSWLLNDLFVAKTVRKQGVGRSLMNQAKTFAIETKAKAISLATAEHNTNAQALYKSLGYQQDKEFYHYFLML